MVETIERAGRRQHPASQKSSDRKRLPLKQKLKQARAARRERTRANADDRIFNRNRAHIEQVARERAHIISEREALRLFRRDAGRRACFVQGVSHGPLDADLGPHEGETLMQFWSRVDRETPRITSRHFITGTAKLRRTAAELLA